VIDLSVIVQAFLTLFQPARELLRIANTLPPVIRGLVNALLNFVIAILINQLVILIIGWAVQVAASFTRGSLPGSGLVLARFMKLFNESSKLMKVCTEPGALGGPCKLIAKFFPKLPKRWFMRCLTELGEEAGELGAEVALGGGITTTDGAMAVIDACLVDKINEVVMDTGFWKRVDWHNRRVYQRDDLIDPRRVAPDGRTSCQRMLKGDPPIGPDGWPIHLHHMLQEEPGPLAEVTQSFHQTNKGTLHMYQRKPPNPVDHVAFKSVREQYWQARAKDFAC
jgi:hypothetical protein